ncbi:succinate dehydrogenase assembly factor 2 [Pleionea litopenaei]|uniref:FAD assembly factor SdhE n=1 Tax=Pleionea litopenaei TaxID=3070815 RepID=A0AA51RW49_9GAMM|nr:succinate dehydrogenase assembly factor 2 [Pleionea sp. HL-JVS1]WMS88595.1 succinate dehydrogenase assembly factor 2 [Pleionea sp. HL-JVS1]
MTQLTDTRKIRYQCRRGLLELDVILQPFADQFLEQLDPPLLGAFVELLEQPDPDIYNWLMGQYPPDDEKLKMIVDHIRKAMNITA